MAVDLIGEGLSDGTEAPSDDLEATTQSLSTPEENETDDSDDVEVGDEDETTSTQDRNTLVKEKEASARQSVQKPQKSDEQTENTDWWKESPWNPQVVRQTEAERAAYETEQRWRRLHGGKTLEQVRNEAISNEAKRLMDTYGMEQEDAVRSATGLILEADYRDTQQERVWYDSYQVDREKMLSNAPASYREAIRELLPEIDQEARHYKISFKAAHDMVVGRNFPTLLTAAQQAKGSARRQGEQQAMTKTRQRSPHPTGSVQAAKADVTFSREQLNIMKRTGTDPKVVLEALRKVKGG